MRNVMMISMVTLGLAACGGGGSGVSANKQIGDLSDDERTQVCDWLGGLEVDNSECATGTTSSSTLTGGGCEAFLVTLGTCDLTVGNIEECNLALADDPCSSALPPECSEYFACVLTVAFGGM